MIQLLLVGSGGFCGAISRYMLGGYIFQVCGAPKFPVGTLAVNVLGCLAIGLIAGAIEHLHVLSGETRLFLITGFLGGFTTFSAFGLETVYLLKTGEVTLGLVNIVASVGLSVAGVAAGFLFMARYGAQLSG